MTEYLEVTSEEVAADVPARASVWAKFKNNVLAMFEGDETNPTPRLQPGAHRRPVAGIVEIAQEAGHIIKANAVRKVYFRASIVAPGTYTFAGTRSGSAVSVIIRKNEADIITVSDNAFSHDITLASGDIIDVTVENTSGSPVSIEDFRLMADYVPVMGQCQFLFRNEFVEGT